jgi:hypothetical protein
LAAEQAQRDGPTLAGSVLAAVVFGLFDWRAHDGWALHPVTQAAPVFRALGSRCHHAGSRL